MKNLNVSHDVFSGDCVAVLLETPEHSYYQIEVNPDGKVFDADRQSGIDPQWESQTQVRSRRSHDFWEVELRIPVVGANAGAADPVHNVVGAKPDAENPWYFTVGRTRAHGEHREVSAFVPTGSSTYHESARFARLIIK
jgi:hypothetical protein